MIACKMCDGCKVVITKDTIYYQCRLLKKGSRRINEDVVKLLKVDLCLKCMLNITHQEARTFTNDKNN